MTNIVTAVFARGRSAKTEGIFQWDHGMILRFEGIELPDTYEVHFADEPSLGSAVTEIGTAAGVVIPDALLETGRYVYAWIYLHAGADDGETVYRVEIPVRPRPKPDGETPTPQQRSAIDQAIAALNAGVEQVEGIAEAIPQTIDAALEAAKESGEFDGPQGEGVPSGGTTGQVLSKASGTDYDTAWTDKNPVVQVSGSTPTITALPGVRYVCGECATLDIMLPASGCEDVVFESGSTPTVLTITPPTGVTVKWANSFDPTSLDADTTYEINIADGLGVAGKWT